MTSRQHRLENFHHGADVVSADAKELGKLHAIVVDPRSNEVTHIVVNTGPRFPEPGFGAPTLIEVPVDQVEDAGWAGLVKILIFLASFVVGGAYAWRKRALEWRL